MYGYHQFMFPQRFHGVLTRTLTRTITSSSVFKLHNDGLIAINWSTKETAMHDLNLQGAYQSGPSINLHRRPHHALWNSIVQYWWKVLYLKVAWIGLRHDLEIRYVLNRTAAILYKCAFKWFRYLTRNSSLWSDRLFNMHLFFDLNFFIFFILRLNHGWWWASTIKYRHISDWFRQLCVFINGFFLLFGAICWSFVFYSNTN